MKTQIDHIEPRWEEGRDYQLVCGLDVVFNMCERERALNSSKSNRFVPWRWSKDELGDVPVEPGDLCLFLTYDTNEWILEEFLGTWWFDQSRLWGYAKTQPQSEETKQKRSKAMKGRVFTPEHRENISKGQKGRVLPPEHREKISRANTGHATSAETREKLRAVHLGRKLSQDHIQKLIEAQAGHRHSEETKQKIREAALRVSDETRQKLSEATTRRHARERCRRMSRSDPQMPDFED